MWSVKCINILLIRRVNLSYKVRLELCSSFIFSLLSGDLIMLDADTIKPTWNGIFILKLLLFGYIGICTCSRNTKRKFSWFFNEERRNIRQQHSPWCHKASFVFASLLLSHLIDDWDNIKSYDLWDKELPLPNEVNHKINSSMSSITDKHQECLRAIEERKADQIIESHHQISKVHIQLDCILLKTFTKYLVDIVLSIKGVSIFEFHRILSLFSLVRKENCLWRKSPQTVIVICSVFVEIGRTNLIQRLWLICLTLT